MAFSPDTFSKAVGKPFGPGEGKVTPPPPGGLDDLFAAPASEEPAMEEPSESSVDPEIMNALSSATPEQLEAVKSALGISGGLRPEEGMDDMGMGGMPPPPASPKPTSKLDKMMAK